MRRASLATQLLQLCKQPGTAKASCAPLAPGSAANARPSSSCQCSSQQTGRLWEVSTNSEGQGSCAQEGAGSMARASSHAGATTSSSAHLMLHVAALSSAAWTTSLSWAQTSRSMPALARSLGTQASASKAAGDAAEAGPQIPTLEEQEKECWSCAHHVKRGSFACQGCEKIQPVDSTLNYFELLGMPNMSFDLNLTRLERQYKLLQWHLHPDKVVGRPVDEQQFAAQQATLINHAYSVLKAPLSRANYILSLKGHDMGEGSTVADPELLMEVLEAREQVESTDDPQELKALLKENQERQAVTVRALSAAFREGTVEDAKKEVTQLTYLVRLQQEIMHKL